MIHAQISLCQDLSSTVFLTCLTQSHKNVHFLQFSPYVFIFDDGSCGTEFRINTIIEIGKQKNFVLEQESITLSDYISLGFLLILEELL